MAVQKITQELMYRVINDFPQCIECSGEDHLSNQTMFFHKGNCKHGLGLDSDTLRRRIDERIAVIEEREKKDDYLLSQVRCAHCTEKATGTLWVKYHKYDIFLSCEPCCDKHSFIENKDERPSGFILGLVTHNPALVDKYLLTI